MPDDDPVITYSIKDLFEKLERTLDHKFELLTHALNSKASAEDVATVMAWKVHYDERLGKVERHLEADDKKISWRTEWRRWITTTLIAAALTAVTILQAIHG